MKRKAFSQEQELFRDSYRKFLQQEVLPRREEFREAGIVDRKLFEKAGEHGFLMIWADEQYGGMGITDFRFQQIMMEENARYGDSGFYIDLHSRLVGPYISHFGSEEQKQRILPRAASGKSILAIAMTEPDVGSDLAGMKCRAQNKGDHWLLNGSKTYISNGINADYIIVAAKTNPDNPRQIGLFIVERDMKGFERGRNLKKMGLKSQDTAELFFNNVEIPQENTLGDPSKGFHYLLQSLVEERLMAMTSYVACSQVAFDLTRDYVMERRAFGKRIADFQNTRFKMAQLRAEIDVAHV